MQSLLHRNPDTCCMPLHPQGIRARSFWDAQVSLFDVVCHLSRVSMELKRLCLGMILSSISSIKQAGMTMGTEGETPLWQHHFARSSGCDLRFTPVLPQLARMP